MLIHRNDGFQLKTGNYLDSVFCADKFLMVIKIVEGSLKTPIALGYSFGSWLRVQNGEGAGNFVSEILS